MQTFVNYRPDVGYVQGMSYIAGIILLHFGPPHECFKVFCNLMSFQILTDFYMTIHDRINTFYKVFWSLLKETCPKLYNQLISEDMVSGNIFLIGWVLTLFSGTQFSIEITACIWDQLMLFGERHILRVALALCKCVEIRVETELIAQAKRNTA